MSLTRVVPLQCVRYALHACNVMWQDYKDAPRPVRPFPVVRYLFQRGIQTSCAARLQISVFP